MDQIIENLSSKGSNLQNCRKYQCKKV